MSGAVLRLLAAPAARSVFSLFVRCLRSSPCATSWDAFLAFVLFFIFFPIRVSFRLRMRRMRLFFLTGDDAPLRVMCILVCPFARFAFFDFPGVTSPFVA